MTSPGEVLLVGGGIAVFIVMAVVGYARACTRYPARRLEKEAEPMSIERLAQDVARKGRWSA